MKSIINLCKMDASRDVGRINEIIGSIEGIIACEILANKREIQVVYNEEFTNLEFIKEAIENCGYIVL